MTYPEPNQDQDASAHLLKVQLPALQQECAAYDISVYLVVFLLPSSRSSASMVIA